jgi:uncharacterized LabA/DUF88 family protein
MDLLYTGRFDGFCIVSSDSDFTRLASRIREQGLTVYGFGERKTPKPFVTACDKFIYSDVLRAEGEVDEAVAPTRKRSGGELRQDSRLVRLLQSAAQAVSDEEGWTTLGSMGTHIAKQAPEFDSRNYGYGKLSELVTATGLFEVETRNGGNNKTLWVRLKRRGKAEGEGRQDEGRQEVRQEARQEPRQEGRQEGRQAEGRGQGRQGEGREQRQAEQRVQERAAESRPGDRLAQGQRHQPAPQLAAMPDTDVATMPPVIPDQAPEPTPEQAPAPREAVAGHVAPTPAADAQPAAGNDRPGGRARRPQRKPEVKLSETPWPIDNSVLVPATMAAVDASEHGDEHDDEREDDVDGNVAVPAAPAAATKRRSTAPRKRAPRKSTKAAQAE